MLFLERPLHVSCSNCSKFQQLLSSLLCSIPVPTQFCCAKVMFLARDLLLFSVVTSSILQCSLFGNSVSKLVSGQSCCAMLHDIHTFAGKPSGGAVRKRTLLSPECRNVTRPWWTYPTRLIMWLGQNEAPDRRGEAKRNLVLRLVRWGIGPV